MRIHYGAARGTGGATDQIAVGVPFYAEETPWSLGGSAVRTARQAHLFQNNVEVARLDEHLEETEAFLGHGWRNDSGVKRVTGSLYSLERRLGPTVWDTTGAPPPASQIGPAEELRLRRIAVEVRFWKPKYVERTGVERVDRVEDFDLGPSLAIKIGLAPRLFGSTADEGYVRIGLDAGAQTRAGFGTLRSSISSRLRGGPLEVIEQADGRWVWQENFDHTVVASLVGIAGHEVPRSFQVVVGGLNGLRAYPVHAVAGTQMVRWNLEDRRILVRDIFHLVSVGEAMFVDGARGWGAGSEGSGAYNAAGFGVRLGPPRAALGPAFRIDFAWPLSPTRDGRRDPVVSFGSTHAF
jgi:hypothetical protein